jgi:hypothetical protein
MSQSGEEPKMSEWYGERTVAVTETITPRHLDEPSWLESEADAPPSDEPAAEE